MALTSRDWTIIKISMQPQRESCPKSQGGTTLCNPQAVHAAAPHVLALLTVRIAYDVTAQDSHYLHSSSVKAQFTMSCNSSSLGSCEALLAAENPVERTVS